MVKLWNQPISCSRIGAAHKRKQKPCQDASAALSFRSRDRKLVVVIAVADGHGGSNYHRSDIGSRIACEQAVKCIRNTFRERPLGSIRNNDEWLRWLADELPQQIQFCWQQEVEKHWHSQPAEAGGKFTATAYGTTLGLVVATPRWWGTTGLGDWDLVLVNSDGSCELISEETDIQATGEATCSICQSQAAALFKPRARLHQLRRGNEPFALLLSTDGIRKSCSTDTDFLTLSSYISQAALPEQQRDEAVDLGEALDKITNQGSGDDVSLAIAVYGVLDLKSSDIPDKEQGKQSKTTRTTTGQPKNLTNLLAWLAFFLLVIVLAGLGFNYFNDQRQVKQIGQQADKLCESKATISANLMQRLGVVRKLEANQLDRSHLLAQVDKDPMSALIAYRFDPHAKNYRLNSSAAPPNHGCRELNLAISKLWTTSTSTTNQDQPIHLPALGNESQSGKTTAVDSTGIDL